MHHTNIVLVFEVGQEGDTRYYALQFITGQGLDAVIEELRDLRSRSAAARCTAPSQPAERYSQAGLAQSFKPAELTRRLAHSLLSDRLTGCLGSTPAGCRPQLQAYLWGLAGCCQLDLRRPAPVTHERAEIERCRKSAVWT